MHVSWVEELDKAAHCLHCCLTLYIQQLVEEALETFPLLMQKQFLHDKLSFVELDLTWLVIDLFAVCVGERASWIRVD